MAAEKGNQYWLARSKHGRDKIISSPEIFWEGCCEYFQWCEDHPIIETKSYMYQGVPVQDQVPHIRATTKAGLCLFLGIDRRTFDVYKQNDDFRAVAELAEETMYSQKFTGAAAGRLNANIIARDLGLVEKAEVQSSVQVNINGKDAEV